MRRYRRALGSSSVVVATKRTNTSTSAKEGQNVLTPTQKRGTKSNTSANAADARSGTTSYTNNKKQGNESQSERKTDGEVNISANFVGAFDEENINAHSLLQPDANRQSADLIQVNPCDETQTTAQFMATNRLSDRNVVDN